MVGAYGFWSWVAENMICFGESIDCVLRIRWTQEGACGLRFI